VADKTVKTKQPEREKQTDQTVREKKPVPAQKPVRTADRGRGDKPRQQNAISKWYRETIGELRKVTWPTPPDAWRLTKVVLIVMGSMALLLGLLDWIFSRLITLLVS